MNLSFSTIGTAFSGALVIGVFEDGALTPTGQKLDEQCCGFISQAMRASETFKGKSGERLLLPALPNSEVAPLVLLGLGTADAVDGKALETFGASAQAALSPLSESAAIVAEAAFAPVLGGDEIAARIAFGAALRSYRFDKYQTTKKPDEKPRLKTLTILSEDAAKAQSAFGPFDALREGIFLTRNLVSEPANVVGPESFVDLCRPLEDLGLGFEVLDENQMADLGMGALLGVAQGSARKPRLLVLTWNGGKEGGAPTAIVGKGVVFDSGGISIKPSGGMEEMKWDMAGAGVVAGLMKTLALRKAPVNVVGLCGLVENMPSGTAQRPGDVVTSMSGQTIEVINTDAEGRLVLADVLHYANERFTPARIIDLATLTGAILIALGNEYAGLFSNDDVLSEALTAAGDATNERLWRLPMGDNFDKMINSDIADMKNAGAREGSSITAAQFLKRFVGNTPWAHLDIAGTAWSKKDAGVVPKGGTGFGVRLLDTFLREIGE